MPCPVPGLIIQGTEDKVVPENAVFGLYQKLDKQKNSDIDYITVQGAGHFFEAQMETLNEELARYIKPRLNQQQNQKKIRRDRRRRQAPEE